MAKRKRSVHNKPARRPKSKRPTRSPSRRREPDLMEQVSDALDAPGPLGLLTFASGILAALDPRRADPFAGRNAEPEFSVGDFVESLVETPTRETTALLAAMAVLGDEIVRTRARRELRARAFPLPGWVADLANATSQAPIRIGDPIGDSEDIVVGVRLAGGDEISALVFVDHNLGSAVKDAIVVGDAVDALATHVGGLTSQEPDVIVEPVDPATARARIEDAIARGAMTYPPLESDSWPAARPIVEWLISGLPSGGSGYEFHEWSELEIADLTDRFFASSHGAVMDTEEARSLLESLLWYGTEYGNADPLRWSEPKVEILLLDWLPRKIIADVEHLAGFPAVLRALIRFGHEKTGIRAGLTNDVLAVVDEFEPEYLAMISSPRPQGAAALLAGMGLEDDLYDDDSHRDVMADFEQFVLDGLARAVGGPDALAGLDDSPLPDEPFDWSSIAGDVHEVVGAVLAVLDRVVGDLLDVDDRTEFRTACRRLLHLAAAGDPAVFRRRAKPETSAAAICWVIGKANRLFDVYGGLTVKQLLLDFGVTGSVSQRGYTLLEAAGFSRPDAPVIDLELGTVDLLVSQRRRQIIADRDAVRDA